MWIAHFAQGLLAKPLAPAVPLRLLAFAGAAPDAAFFVLALLGVERWSLDPALVGKGCFPYACDYPYSHSLAGMAVIGAILAAVYALTARKPVSFKDLAIITAVSASHFLLEWPSHRADVRLTPASPASFGAGLFDHPTAVFATELALFAGGLWVYAAHGVPHGARDAWRREPVWPAAVLAAMVVQQAVFSFGSAPTRHARWVHAPAFLAEILASTWLLGKLEA